MQNHSLCEFKSFSGFLQVNGSKTPIIFRARISSSGKVEFEFEQIARTKENSFIEDHWHHSESKPSYFSLTGKAEDCTELTTESLYFLSLSIGDHMSFRGGQCSRAVFNRKLAKPRPKPLIRKLLKGFSSSHSLNLKCHLGTISMVEYPPNGQPDAITGSIIIESDNEQINPSVWRNEVDELFEHVLRVMSFACGIILQTPIIEFYSGDKLEVVVLSKDRQAASASFPVFSYVNRQPIFETAVNSYISPPFKVKNLFIAIDWFAMNSNYAEVRLVNAMTVLENLISSNLDEKDTLILDKKEFKVLRKKLQECIDQHSIEDAEQQKILSHMICHLPNLNRQSIVQKLYILADAEHWKVPLDGISQKQIKAAKNARDLVVHRGHYDKDKKNDLSKHASVVREIVIRFLFTVLGYQGRYISHLNGFQNDAQFLPLQDVDKTSTDNKLDCLTNP